MGQRVSVQHKAHAQHRRCLTEGTCFCLQLSPTPPSACLPRTQMTTEWGAPGCWLRLSALAAASRRVPLSTSEAQEPQARATDQPKLTRTSCTCRAPYWRAVSAKARSEYLT